MNEKNKGAYLEELQILSSEAFKELGENIYYDLFDPHRLDKYFGKEKGAEIRNQSLYKHLFDHG